jgi:hypothetical protein
MLDRSTIGHAAFPSLLLLLSVGCASPLGGQALGERGLGVHGTSTVGAAGAVNASGAAHAAVDRRAIQPEEPALWPSVEGRHTLGGSTGWAWYEGDVELTDTSGTPDLGTGQDDTDLDPIAGGALKYNYFLTENFALGAVFEFRSFDPNSVQPLASEIFPDEYSSIHYLLSTRVYSDPLKRAPRVKLFGGLDLGYVDGIELDATVVYSPSFQERITLEGDEFFTLGAVGGMSLWIGDWIGCDASFELGGFYEWALDPTEDTITLNIPSGGGGTNANLVDGEVTPGGWIVFAGLTVYL